MAKGSALSSVIPQSDSVDDSLAQDVASVLGIRWRRIQPPAPGSPRSWRVKPAPSSARSRSRVRPRSHSRAPRAASRSRSATTRTSIRVGVSLDSSNPALTSPTSSPSTSPPESARHSRSTSTSAARTPRRSRPASGRPTARRSAPTDVQRPFLQDRCRAVGRDGPRRVLVLAALVRRFSRRRTGAVSRPNG